MLNSNWDTRDLARSGFFNDFAMSLQASDNKYKGSFVLRATDKAPLTAIKTNTAKDAFVDKLPVTPLYISRVRHFQGIWNALSEGQVGPMAQNMTKELDAQFQEQRTQLLNAYQGPVVVTVLAADKEDAMPVVPVGLLKSRIQNPCRSLTSCM